MSYTELRGHLHRKGGTCVSLLYRAPSALGQPLVAVTSRAASIAVAIFYGMVGIGAFQLHLVQRVLGPSMTATTSYASTIALANLYGLKVAGFSLVHKAQGSLEKPIAAVTARANSIALALLCGTAAAICFVFSVELAFLAPLGSAYTLATLIVLALSAVKKPDYLPSPATPPVSPRLPTCGGTPPISPLHPHEGLHPQAQIGSSSSCSSSSELALPSPQRGIPPLAMQRLEVKPIGPHEEAGPHPVSTSSEGIDKPPLTNVDKPSFIESLGGWWDVFGTGNKPPSSRPENLRDKVS